MLVSLAYPVVKLAGSLVLTVVILILLVGVMLWGTVVEKNYGATAAKFGIYGAWWFNALGLILAINSAVALVLRLPWKRQHMGFVIPHIGLIVLLAGCYLSRHYGVEATLAMFEGDSSDLAYKSSAQHVELDGQQHFKLRVFAGDGREQIGDIVVPFTSGPFSWSDYQDGTLAFLPGLHLPPWLANIPWSLAHRDHGVIYDHDGIRLEVLDYLSNSEIVSLASLAVEAAPLQADGRPSLETARDCRLSVKVDAGPHSADHRFGIGDEQTLAGGQRILFWMAGSPEETVAFRHSAPAGPLGRLGRVVLYAGGKSYDWSIDDWKPGTRRALGDSGLEAEIVDLAEGEINVGRTTQFDSQIHLNIHHGSESHPLVLSAEFPGVLCHQDYDDMVFGSYWRGQGEKPKEPPPVKSETAGKSDAAGKPETAGKPEAVADARPAFGPPRIDFFAGADQQLYLRTWRAGEARIFGPLKMTESGGSITAFRNTPAAVALQFSEFEPECRLRPLPFNKNDNRFLRQAQVRLTVDDQSAEFWMPCSLLDPLEKLAMPLPEPLLNQVVVGQGRRVALSFAPESFHLGYTIHVRKAWRKLDPGSHKVSFYGSEIDMTPNDDALASAKPDTASGQAAAYENLLVTLNAPLDFADPAHPGRSYRMFQAMMPPHRYTPQERKLKMGEPAYMTGFTLNYDPGRGVTYVGCLLVVAGIFVAYFVRFVGPGRNRAPIAVGEET
jgi:hypothetical protein